MWLHDLGLDNGFSFRWTSASKKSQGYVETLWKLQDLLHPVLSAQRKTESFVTSSASCIARIISKSVNRRLRIGQARASAATASCGRISVKRKESMFVNVWQVMFHWKLILQHQNHAVLHLGSAVQIYLKRSWRCCMTGITIMLLFNKPKNMYWVL